MQEEGNIAKACNGEEEGNIAKACTGEVIGTTISGGKNNDRFNLRRSTWKNEKSNWSFSTWFINN